MTLDDIWAELELTPTDDTRAIRRSYARKLKTLHPEDEPEAFKRLRAAYELAMQLAEEGVPADAVSPPEPSEPLQPPPSRTSDPAVAQAPAPAPAPTPEAEADPLQAHWERCRSLIAQIDAGADEAVLVEGLREIFAQPILEHLEVYQQTGLGFARSLLERTPRGDVLVHPVLNHFGWRKAGVWGAPPEVDALISLGDRITDRHALRAGKAYRILTQPPPRRANRDTRWDLPSVMRLIRDSMGEEAWVAAELNKDAVRWWSRYGDPRRARRKRQLTFLAAALGLVAVFVLLSYLSKASSGAASSPVPMDQAEQLAAAADARPNDPQAWADLCDVTARHWWRTSSLSDCDRAATLNPGRVEVQLDRGFLYIKTGDAHAAEKAFDAILEPWPDHPVALYGRSLARSMIGAIPSGRRDWCRAQRIDPEVRRRIEVEWEFRVDGAYAPCGT